MDRRFRAGEWMLRALALLLIFAVAGCADEEAPGVGEERSPPNFLWVVWDTVRADRLSVYGYPEATTPKLERWSKGARVYEDVISTASSTVPSHAAMFTGLLPTQHGTHNGHRWLDDEYLTIAEILRDAGYATYLWAANPHIAAAENFGQGFDREAHPWDDEYREEALAIVRKKGLGDNSTELGKKLRGDDLGPWAIKAAGQLAQRDLLSWLSEQGEDRPYFAFLNYMEAHRPFIPSRRHRKLTMSPEQVKRSYQVDRSWAPMWRYTFGLHEYTDQELEIMARTYDATLIELDDLFDDLIHSLDARGFLENTVIILVSDHGEHLGEHHMLDHQYSLYRPLIHVPLIVKYPKRFKPGRDDEPVMNFDLFPTILELAGIAARSEHPSRARSLLDPDPKRLRLSEYPAVFKDAHRAVRKGHSGWDEARYSRRLRALQDDTYKLIWGEDQRHELYDVKRDLQEAHDLFSSQPEEAKRMLDALDVFTSGLSLARKNSDTAPELEAGQREMLEGLGYVLDEADAASPRKNR